MKVKISTLIKLSFCFFLMIECGTFNTIGVNIPFSDRITLILTIFMGVLGRCSIRYYPRISKYCRSLNMYLLFYLFFIGAEAVYSSIVYSTNGIRLVSMIINYRYLLFPLWVYPILYVIDTDGDWNSFLKIILTIGVLDNLVRSISYIAYSTGGVTLFPSVVETFTSRMRNGRFRLGAGTLHTLAFNIALYYGAVHPRKRQRRIYFLISLFFLIFQIVISMGRTQIMCYIITIAAYMYFVYLRNSSHAKYYRFIFLIAVAAAFVYALCADYLSAFLSSLFSTDRNISSEAGSAIARMYAIGYYWSIVKDRILLGLGLLYNDGKELFMILRGNGMGYGEVAYTEDLGFLGQFFNYGIVGTCIFGVLLIRWMSITVKAYRNGEIDKYALLIPLFVHGITQTFTSMSLFQANKFVYVPIYLVIFEYSAYASNHYLNETD